MRNYPRAAPPKRSAWEAFKRKVDDIEPTNFVKGIIAANVAVWLAFQYGQTARVGPVSLSVRREHPETCPKHPLE
jgi:hypothetical protein